MASTLVLDFDDLSAKVGQHIGYGRTSGNWTTEQEAVITEIVNAGYRQVLSPPTAPGERRPHLWSFLIKTDTQQFTADDYDYGLDDDVGGIVGNMTYIPDDNISNTVRVVSQLQWEAAYQYNDSSGVPDKVAIFPTSHAGTAEYDREMRFHPVPDSTYTVNYRYYWLAPKLDSSNKYPGFGPEHADLLLQSCLDKAEQWVEDTVGQHHQLFLERLAASVALDRRVAPHYLGYASDPSVSQEMYGRHQGRSYTVVYTP